MKEYSINLDVRNRKIRGLTKLHVNVGFVIDISAGRVISTLPSAGINVTICV